MAPHFHYLFKKKAAKQKLFPEILLYIVSKTDSIVFVQRDFLHFFPPLARSAARRRERDFISQIFQRRNIYRRFVSRAHFIRWRKKNRRKLQTAIRDNIDVGESTKAMCQITCRPTTIIMQKSARIINPLPWSVSLRHISQPRGFNKQI